LPSGLSNDFFGSGNLLRPARSTLRPGRGAAGDHRVRPSRRMISPRFSSASLRARCGRQAVARPRATSRAAPDGSGRRHGTSGSCAASSQVSRSGVASVETDYRSADCESGSTGPVATAACRLRGKLFSVAVAQAGRTGLPCLRINPARGIQRSAKRAPTNRDRSRALPTPFRCIRPPPRIAG
jgi:hypothetical protein